MWVPEEQAPLPSLHSRHRGAAADPGPLIRRALLDIRAVKSSISSSDLGNLLYYDIRGEVIVYGPEYQPSDPVELERLMGGQEVYRAFLLATIE
jgi:hypothetical protein